LANPGTPDVDSPILTQVLFQEPTSEANQQLINAQTWGRNKIFGQFPHNLWKRMPLNLPEQERHARMQVGKLHKWQSPDKSLKYVMLF
jgi:hypothetical protein